MIRALIASAAARLAIAAAPRETRASLASTETAIVTPEQLLEFLNGHASDAGETVTIDSAMRVGAVYRSVQIISGAVCRLPVLVKQQVSDREYRLLPDHPVARLMNRKPNKFMNGLELRRLLMVHLLFRGNAYFVRVEVAGRLVGLLPLHPDRVTLRPQPDMTIRYDYTTKDGRQVEYRASQVVHFRGMSIDGVRGLSVLGYAREAIGLSLASQRHGAQSFRNGAKIGSILKTNPELSPEARANYEAALREFNSPERAHSTLILEDGESFERVGMTHADAQFVEMRGMSRVEIAMYFGVPPHMLGDQEKQTSYGSGIEHQAVGFVTWTIGDWIAAIEAALTCDLIDQEREPDVTVELDRRELLRLDSKARWQGHTSALQWGVKSPDEVRWEEGMNPRPDGDGGTFYPPPNMTRSETSQSQEEDDAERR